MTNGKLETVFLANCTALVQDGGILPRDIARRAFLTILKREAISVDLYWGALFAAVKARGVNLDETLGFVDAMFDFDGDLPRSFADRVALPRRRPVVACTGSGKESFKTFNLSTCAAFIAAGCGIDVVKPCSESTSAVSGATDVLRALGVRISASKEEASAMLEATNLCFIDFTSLAPRYAATYNGAFFHFHPLSYIAPPLCIPFQVDAVAHGIADDNVTHGARLIGQIGFTRAAVFSTKMSNDQRVDELLPRGHSRVAWLDGSTVTEEVLLHGPPTGEELHQIRHRASHRENADAIMDVLAGTAPEIMQLAAAWNAAGLLRVVGAVASLDEGVARAREAIRSGAALARLHACVAYAGAASPVASRAPAAETSVHAAAVAAVRELEAIPAAEGYAEVPREFAIGRERHPGFFGAKFLCHDRADRVNDVPVAKAALVTGFGPTNSPTAGTLSVLLKAISLQRRTGLYTEIIISDLGAWNSRNLDWRTIERNTNRFVDFIAACGFDRAQGQVRTHKDNYNLVTSGLISKYLSEEDFTENREATDRLYDLMKLRGSQFSIMIDVLYTVADILKPLFEGRDRVLMLSGIEEHYFTQLARKVVERMNAGEQGFVRPGVQIGALYARLVGGLYPHPKMSKSIPPSAINIGDSTAEIERKILHSHPADERVILQMMELVSDWEPARIEAARLAYEEQADAPLRWMEMKRQYTDFFLGLADLWSQVS
ncbi:MAG TPA: hypothetical protein VN947_13760 [Polyangia bacterium]|nr:hypothetical protein [Polyangia bacterium]